MMGGSTRRLAAVEDAGQLKIKECDKQPEADATLAEETVNNAEDVACRLGGSGRGL